MRADKAITQCRLDFGVYYEKINANYINQLRVERLMAKAELAKEQRKKYYEDADDEYPEDPITIRYNRWNNIAEALEARARRIKEGM